MAAFGRRTPLPEAATEARRLMAAELHARGFRNVFESADPIEDLRLRLADGTQLPLRPLAERCSVEPRRVWQALTHHYVAAVLEVYQAQRRALTLSPATPAPEAEGPAVPAGADLVRPPSPSESALTRVLLANLPAPDSAAVDLPSPVTVSPRTDATQNAEPVAAPVGEADAARAGPERPATHPIATVSHRDGSAPRSPAPTAGAPLVPPARSVSQLGPAPEPTVEHEGGERFDVAAVEAIPAAVVRPSHPGPPPPPEHLDALRRAVRARLLTAPPADEDSWHYSRRVASGLHVGLELLVGRTTRLLLDSEIAQMPFSLDELFHSGWLASAAEPIDEDREVAPGIRMLSGASHYVATKAADPARLDDRFGTAPHGVVIAVPHRHAVLYHVVWRDSVLVVEEMAHLAETLATGAPETTPGGGLSSALYFWSERQLERIDLRSAPTGRFARALTTALI